MMSFSNLPAGRMRTEEKLVCLFLTFHYSNALGVPLQIFPVGQQTAWGKVMVPEGKDDESRISNEGTQISWTEDDVAEYRASSNNNVWDKFTFHELSFKMIKGTLDAALSTAPVAVTMSWAGNPRRPLMGIFVESSVSKHI